MLELIGILKDLCLFLYSVYIKIVKYKTIRLLSGNVWGLKKKKFVISVPVYEKEFVGFDYPVVTYEETVAISKLINFLQPINYSIEISKDSDHDEKANLIHIGGPAANIRTNAIFHEKFGDAIKFHVSIKEDYFEKSKIYKWIFRFESDFTGVKFQNKNVDNSFIYKKEETDFAFLVKLTSSDTGSDRNIFILWGIEMLGTKRAVDYFINYHDELYRDFKEKHFFIAVKVNAIDGSYNQEYTDLTQIVFHI